MPGIELKGKIMICGNIKAETGLHIGSANPGLQVGGIDLPVIRNPFNTQPFIPGSSLRGKMRSLLEHHLNLEPNRPIQAKPPVRIHECKTSECYNRCPVCNVFGVAVDVTDAYDNLPSRLIVRDASLKNFVVLEQKKTDLPYTEAKIEISVDRITAQAVPRTIERVPAGALFRFEMVFNVIDETKDLGYFPNVLLAMRLLEDDYLGGHGARGSGKVSFDEVSVILRSRMYYEGKGTQCELAIDQKIACLQKMDWNRIITKCLPKKQNLDETFGKMNG